jgi:two-component system, NtrC family, response regulator AtoC
VPVTRNAADGEDTPVSGGPTVTVRTPDDQATDRLSALIISDRAVNTRPLPASGELVVGRAPDCDLVIDDPSMSRRHAVLAMSPLAVRDLESANGTRVRDAKVGDQPVPVAPGDVIQFGRVTVILQRRTAAVRTERLWGHDYFEMRLAEECARAVHRGPRSFAVARLRCDPLPPVHTVWTILLAEARSSDVVAEYGPREYEILLHDVSPASAAAAVDRIAEQLRRRGVRLTTGCACFPVDGRSADELLHRAAPYTRAPAGGESVVVTADRRMQDLYRLAERIAAGQITVLILGETGVGKEVLAAHIHRSSPRAAGPYLRLSCASLSETLLESELFGHERGAFTGAVAAKPGLFETADGGTVFLDEIGELPAATQSKLLRVLEERTVLRVGALKPRAIDVRFIAATNRDLEAECVRGRFREDLYFRLSGASVVVPPLRERPDEIEPLARAFIAQAAGQLAVHPEPTLGPEVLALLRAYSWPGNIRELRNAMERAVLLCAPGPVLPAHLPLEKMRVTTGVQELSAAPAEPDHEVDDEKQRILDALAACAGNQTEAARRLGIGRRTLIKRLVRYGIQRPRKG